MSNSIAEEVSQWGMQPPAPFELTDLSTDEQTLWRQFPADYRATIEAVNGGRLQEALYFDVPIVWENEGERREGKQTALEEIWTWQTLGEPAPEAVSSVLHEHFGRHLAEQFLPDGFFVIGRASQNSLVAISTRPDDAGTIFYWEWYWNSPWYQGFFKARLAAAFAAFDNAPGALQDPSHPSHEAVVDAANYATLIRVADSWTAFVRELHPERVG